MNELELWWCSWFICRKIHSNIQGKDWCFQVGKDPMQGFMSPPNFGAGLHIQTGAQRSLSFLSFCYSVSPSCCKARWQTWWLLSEAASLMMWSPSFCGPDPQLGQIITAPLGFTAAMWNYSCWLQLLGIQPVPNKEPNETTLAHGDGCQKFRSTAVDPKANLGCDVIAHHCATEPVL